MKPKPMKTLLKSSLTDNANSKREQQTQHRVRKPKYIKQIVIDNPK